jgi:hypothetical protein
MSDNHVCYQMWHGHRDALIRAHDFYVSQAKARLLTRFGNIEAEADQAAKDALEAYKPRFDPDRHDPSDFYESAHEVGLEFYELLTDMREDTRLGVIAGFFQHWEKKLRQWLADETVKWHRDGEVTAAIWKVKIEDLFDLIESWGWALRQEPWFKDLDCCRMVVNVHKHGDGPSLNALALAYPQYLPSPFSALQGFGPVSNNNPSHEHLTVNDNDLDVFAGSIVEFWRAVPENVTFGQIKVSPPAWFVKAYNKNATKVGLTP